MSSDDSAEAGAAGASAELATLLDSIGTFSRQLSRSLSRKRPGFSLGEWLLLRRLALSSPISLVAIAKELGVSRQRVQKQIAALAEEGLVTTRGDPTDERKKQVELTQAGRARLGELDAVVEAEAADLPAEAVARAQVQLQRLAENLRAKAGKPKGRVGKTVRKVTRTARKAASQILGGKKGS